MESDRAELLATEAPDADAQVQQHKDTSASFASFGRVGVALLLVVGFFCMGLKMAEQPASSSPRGNPDAAVSFMSKTGVSQEALDQASTGYCSDTQKIVGNMTYIASSNDITAPWPNLSTQCYSWISACLLMPPVCDPSKLSKWSGFADATQKGIRNTYREAMGTDLLDVYQGRLTNYYLMKELMETITGADCTQEEFEGTLNQISNEINMLKSVSAWFTVYASFYEEINSQMETAFGSSLAILAMPAQSPVKVQKKNVFGIVLKCISGVASILMMATGVGGAVVAEKVFKAAAESEKAGKAAEEAVKGVQRTINVVSGFTSAMDGFVYIAGSSQACAASDTCGTSDSGAADTSSGTKDTDKSVLEYAVFIELLSNAMSSILASIQSQESAIASDWGRLQRAATLAMGCAMNPVLVSHLVAHAFPAMQWVALGVLMRPKYAIYWQRDYTAGTTDGLNCYFNGVSDGDNTGCQNTGSDAGCYTVTSPLDSSYFYGQFSKDTQTCAVSGNVEQGSGNKNFCYQTNLGICDAPTRKIWVGEKGSPSNTPPKAFWEALSNKEGPIQKYINLVYHQDYSTGWSPFVESCSYMTKVYTPPNSGSSMKTDTWWTSPSSTSVPCDVYGIHLETYAFPDCETLKKESGSGLSGQCVNGYGSDGGTHAGSGSGNFNEKVFIPYSKKHWGSIDSSDGKIGCCMPWMDMPDDCDMMICDCWNLIEAEAAGWFSASQGETWGLTQCKAYTDTSSYTSDQMLQTSVGPNWGWTALLDSGGTFCSNGNNGQCPTGNVCGRFDSSEYAFQCCNQYQVVSGITWCANSAGGECSDGIDQNCLGSLHCGRYNNDADSFQCCDQYQVVSGLAWCANSAGGACSEGIDSNCMGSLHCGRFDANAESFQCCDKYQVVSGVAWCANSLGDECSQGQDNNCMAPLACGTWASSSSGYACCSDYSESSDGITTCNSV